MDVALRTRILLTGALAGILMLSGTQQADAQVGACGVTCNGESGYRGYLSSDQTGLICSYESSEPSEGGLQPCSLNEAWTSYDGQLHCTSKSGALAADVTKRIQDLEAKALGLMARANALLPPVPRGVYAGVTPMTTMGRIQLAGRPDGLLSAHARCGQAFAGAHMCSAYELYRSVRTGRLIAAASVPKAWIYMPAGKRPDSMAALPDDGLADNCGGYTVAAGAQRWSGTAVEWTALPSGAVGFKFHGGTSAPCDQPLPIACCK